MPTSDRPGADHPASGPLGAAGDGPVSAGRDIDYRYFFDQNPAPMWIYESASLRFLDVNEAAIRHYGYSRDEFLAMTIEDIRPPEDLPRLRAVVKDRPPGYRHAGRWRHRVKSGAIIDVDISSVRIELPERPVLLVVARDVTEQVQAEAALREAEAKRHSTQQRFERIVELVQEAIWIHDQGIIIFANPAAARLYGAPDAASLIGRSAFDFLEPEDRKRALRRTAKMVGDLQPLPPTEMHIVGLDGKTRVAELQAVPFRQGDKLLAVASGRDVTAQRDAEARLLQVQKMEAVGQLTGGIAHDFNNLLTIIIGALDQEPTRFPPGLAPVIEQAMRAAERGAALTHRLLAFSRQQTLIAGAVDFNRLVAGMEDLLRRTLGEQVEIDMVPAGDLWPALADSGQVENALLNLAINARDAMEGGGTLTIETANVRFDEEYAAANPGVAAGDYAMLAVSDTGTGMTPEVLARAFEPFFTTKEVGKGTGLGLAMIYGFAKQSRGHVLIYSEVGQGTTVKLYLPRLVAEEAGAAEVPASATGAGGGEIILVVEDDANLRKLVLRQLTDLGYRVIEAANGKQALQIIDSDAAIDLLFTDVVMPGGMNGRQLAEAARQRRPGLKALFTSGYTADTIQRQGKLEPGTHLLSKPYRKRDLAQKIREALEG